MSTIYHEKRCIAERFTEGDGIILALKASNPNTRYFNVSSLSCYEEEEALFMGSSLEIVNIYDGNQWNKRYISAMRMMEQIVSGHFTDENEEVKVALLAMIDYILAPTILEEISGLLDNLAEFLVDEEYDTDSIIEDIEIQASSNIATLISQSASPTILDIRDTIGMYSSVNILASF